MPPVKKVPEDQTVGVRTKEPARMIVREKKKILAIDPKYVLTPYLYTIPQSASSKRYITGQEHVLSEEKMTRKKELSASDLKALHMGDNPIIHNPFDFFPIRHNRTFVLDREVNTADPSDYTYLNPQDAADFILFSTTAAQDIVAPRKDVFMKGKHFFYIEDRELEAAELVSSLDLQYEAEKFVRSSASMERWKDVILMLNFEQSGYDVDPDVLTETRLKENVLTACHEYPKTVLKLKEKDSDLIMFCLKLMKYKIIERLNGTEFYAGDTFVGANLEAVKAFVSNTNNASLVTNWGRQIEKQESRIIEPV